jgi:hypothetical protein
MFIYKFNRHHELQSSVVTFNLLTREQKNFNIKLDWHYESYLQKEQQIFDFALDGALILSQGLNVYRYHLRFVSTINLKRCLF